ncbi:MAG TPA: DUF423 domain-containing protein [Roseiarcus sp.]|nr:DUF423 domain-containing protein [Roseiarcus sp.]
MSRPALLLATLAALLGAAGVALAAAAAHENGGELGRTASLFLIMHAAAALAVASHARHRSANRAVLACGFLMEFGAALFAADLAVRAFTGARLFPFAAPIGGSVTIASWIALAVAFGAAWAASPKDAATQASRRGPAL